MAGIVGAVTFPGKFILHGENSGIYNSGGCLYFCPVVSVNRCGRVAQGFSGFSGGFFRNGFLKQSGISPAFRAETVGSANQKLGRIWSRQNPDVILALILKEREAVFLELQPSGFR